MHTRPFLYCVLPIAQLLALLWGGLGCRRQVASAPTASAAAPAVVAIAAIAEAVDGGGATATPFYASRFSRVATVPEMTALGRTLFFAKELSASGRQACATCHVPARAFGPDSDRAVQPGGLSGELSGTRAVPSLRYLHTVPRFNEHYQDSDGDGTDQGPAGGYTWDGRAQTAHDQARLPLLSDVEMANRSPAELIERVRRSPHAAALRGVFGADVLDDTDRGLRAILMAFEVYQQSAAEFYPYDSKYDAVLRRTATLSPVEERGLRLFNDPSRGNCASCHPSAVKEGAFPQFTDFGYVALGVPRNAAIPANKRPDYFDLGLCGPFRTDFAGRKDYCGLFRTPSLRNVALKRRFFHNGAMSTLKDVLRFYAQRDSQPERFYPRAEGGDVRAFDDLPAEYHSNINRDPPFGRKRGAKPSLSDAEIDDLIAFLATLTDGYKPAQPPSTTRAAIVSRPRP